MKVCDPLSLRSHTAANIRTHPSPHRATRKSLSLFPTCRALDRLAADTKGRNRCCAMYDEKSTVTLKLACEKRRGHTQKGHAHVPVLIRADGKRPQPLAKPGWQTWHTRDDTATDLLFDAARHPKGRGVVVVKPSPTQHNTTQHNTTQHNTTQHNTTQHNTTQQATTPKPVGSTNAKRHTAGDPPCNLRLGNVCSA